MKIYFLIKEDESIKLFLNTIFEPQSNITLSYLFSYNKNGEML